jgi:hypothetical protein
MFMSHEHNAGQDHNVRTYLKFSEYVQSLNTWEQL